MFDFLSIVAEGVAESKDESVAEGARLTMAETEADGTTIATEEESNLTVCIFLKPISFVTAKNQNTTRKISRKNEIYFIVAKLAYQYQCRLLQWPSLDRSAQQEGCW